MPLTLILHGGAWNMPDEAVAPARKGLEKALQAGWERLKQGGDALDAIEASIRVMEDDPEFDAGRGSRLNRDGKVELDASIMDGEDLKAGAVAAIQCVRHPISVARLVMKRTPHVMLAGVGARQFAEAEGAELCETDDLLVGRERERFMRVRAGETSLIDNEFDDPDSDDGPMGTVGAIAMDASGRLAAGTSTGGIQDKLAGRVGDTPIIGAGTYADNRKGAASATGWGEGILRVSLTKTAVELIGSGRHPRQAGLQALDTLEFVRGKAGLILMNPQGEVGAVFNTPRMSRAAIDEEHGARIAVDRTDPF